jgi:hypothetical protein
MEEREVVTVLSNSYAVNDDYDKYQKDNRKSSSFNRRSSD